MKPGLPHTSQAQEAALQALHLDWNVSIKDALQDDYIPLNDTGLGNLARNNPDFAGVVKYEALWQVEDPSLLTVIDLGLVGETAQLWINDVYCGSTLHSPHSYPLVEKLFAGENKICVLVCNNLGYRHRDVFSELLPLPPTGLVGPVQVG